MLLFGVCFVLYFIKLSAGKGFFISIVLVISQGFTRYNNKIKL